MSLRRLEHAVAALVGDGARLGGLAGTNAALGAEEPRKAIKTPRQRLPRQELVVVEDFELSLGGGTLPEVRATVEQWGDPSLGGERTVLIMPSFSHGPHVASSMSDPSPGWWESMLGPSKPIDTNSILGSPLGSTNPTTTDPRTGRPYRMSFPSFTPMDQARVHAELLQRFGLERVHAVVGSSLGGMQALQFASLFPERVSRLVALVTTPKTTPASVALRHVQRQAILSDPAWKKGEYGDEVGTGKRGPVNGLRVARMLGMVAYRSREEFDARFDWSAGGDPRPDSLTFEVESFLNYQGQKFDFDANAYLLLSKAMDLQDLANPHAFPGRTLEEAIARIRASSLFIGVQQDILTPAAELEAAHRILLRAGRSSRFELVDSIFGHDAFLKEYERMGPLIRAHLEQGLEEQLSAEEFHTTGLSAP